MDWFGMWDPVPYLEVERVDPPADIGMFVAWVIVATLAVIAATVWYRQRVARQAFWCATAGRVVEVRMQHGWVLSCSAFEDPTAIACGRRCRDRSFRLQWPSPVRS